MDRIPCPSLCLLVYTNYILITCGPKPEPGNKFQRGICIEMAVGFRASQFLFVIPNTRQQFNVLFLPVGPCWCATDRCSLFSPGNVRGYRGSYLTVMICLRTPRDIPFIYVDLIFMFKAPLQIPNGTLNCCCYTVSVGVVPKSPVTSLFFVHRFFSPRPIVFRGAFCVTLCCAPHLHNVLRGLQRAGGRRSHGPRNG